MTDPGWGQPAPRERVTSLANPRVKAAARLRDRRERERTGLTIVDGAREILRALDAGVRVETAFIAPELLRTDDAAAVARRIGGHATTTEVTPAVLGKVAFGDRSDGVVIVVAPPERQLDDLDVPDDPLIVIVERVEKPGNLGAILRSADAAHVAAVIAADPLTDLFNPNAIRASLGTIFTVPVVSAPAATTLAWLVRHRIRPVVALVDANVSYTATDLTGPLAVVLGSEAAGLSEAWRAIDATAVSIPMAGVADSLNVSVAAAVLLFEAVRQRSADHPTVMSDPAH